MKKVRIRLARGVLKNFSSQVPRKKIENSICIRGCTEIFRVDVRLSCFIEFWNTRKLAVRPFIIKHHVLVCMATRLAA